VGSEPFARIWTLACVKLRRHFKQQNIILVSLIFLFAASYTTRVLRTSKPRSCKVIYPAMLRCLWVLLPSSYGPQSGLALNCQTYDYQNLVDKLSTRSRKCGQHKLTEHNVKTASSRWYYSNGQDAMYVHKDRYSKVKHNLWVFYCYGALLT